MNILVLSHLYPRPRDTSYGIFVHRQVTNLQKLGHHVTVLSPTPWSPRVLHFNAKWRDYGLTPARVNLEGVDVYYTRYLRLPGAWFRTLAGFTIYRSLLRLAANLHNEQAFGVVHSNVLLPDGLGGAYLGRKLDLPTVCTVRGSDAFIYPQESRLTLSGTRTAIRQTEQLVTVSQALIGAVERLEEPSRPICVVYDGVSIEEFGELGTADRAPLRQVSNRPYILFVGRQIKVKGLGDLLVAFAQLVNNIDHNLVVIGATPQEVKRLDPRLNEFLKDRLIVLGPLLPDEIPKYMNNCAFLVLPSHSEGLGNVILEAMACGKAVVGTRVTSIPEMVIHDVTGLLVQPGDVSDLARAIQSLINDPARADEMGWRGKERVAKEFTWEQNASQMVSVYKDVIDARSAV